MVNSTVSRIVVLVQENHTADNYFRGLAPYGANVARDWPIQANPPGSDQPHDRHAYYRWLTGQHKATRTQFDTANILPFYAYLALTGAFLENHCSGFGTNSTPNHLLIGADAVAGKLPPLTYLWHTSPEDEHPTADVTIGMNKIWESVDAVVTSGGWDETVFLLTWDDWGGWDDHMSTPNVEHTPDGVQLAYGPRVPLIMFGGPVRAGIDSRWSNHASIPKTVMQLLGLPKLGVERVDNDPGLADLIDPALHNPEPPAYGSRITLPAPPPSAPTPNPLPPPPTVTSTPVAPVALRGGGTLPPPNDVPLAPTQH